MSNYNAPAPVTTYDAPASNYGAPATPASDSYGAPLADPVSYGTANTSYDGYTSDKPILVSSLFNC